MAHYTARVLDDRRLELPKGALTLAVPGQEIEIDLQDNPSGSREIANEKVLAMLRDLDEMKKNMPESDPDTTNEIIRLGRSGALYGDCD